MTSSFCVQKFNLRDGRPVPGDAIPLESSVDAIAYAHTLKDRAAGVAAFEVLSGQAGEVIGATLLVQYGRLPDVFSDELLGLSKSA